MTDFARVFGCQDPALTLGVDRARSARFERHRKDLTRDLVDTSQKSKWDQYFSSLGHEERSMLTTAVKMDPIANGRVSVHPISPTRAEVRIAGELPIVWPERFAAALAPNAISILHGEAERRGESWTGFFELEQAHDSVMQIDYVSILQSLPMARLARPIAVLHHGLVRLTNALRLAIQAEDRQGLLADVLAKLKHLGLYPKRLTIDVASGIVTQCFWLTGYGDREPDLQTERTLREFLSSSRKLRRS
jgi:hypothetical protein